ncbi:hypothetical protein DL93DRAFT_2221905 [Clavulina sp. PMI_390]|nr:hypothetical protein DL93DRAFT_2221905 [Clavulina sp. PMI_390]
MSDSFSPPPRSASFDLVSDATESARTPSPSPPAQASQHMYYRLYQDGVPLASYQAFGPSSDDRGDRIGRLHIDDITPPRGIQSLKRYIARLEGFNIQGVANIFLSRDSVKGEEETTRLDFSTASPGSHPLIPVHAVILDGARRSLPQKLLLPVLHHTASPQLLSTHSSAMIYNDIFWDVNSNGYGEPALLSPLDNSWSICGSCEPPGWKRAHIKKRSLDPLLLQKNDLSRPTGYGVIGKSDALLVDDRSIITNCKSSFALYSIRHLG